MFQLLLVRNCFSFLNELANFESLLTKPNFVPVKPSNSMLFYQKQHISAVLILCCLIKLFIKQHDYLSC